MITEIEISDLSPGEYALDGQKIAKLLTALEAGEILPPIRVNKISERHIAFDGNHRVRAWVEFHQSSNQRIPPIPCVIHVPTLKDLPKSVGKEWERIADSFDKGPEAFLSMKVSNRAGGNSYDDLRDAEKRRIRRLDRE